MNQRCILLFSITATIASLLIGCAVPRAMWPQKDIQPSETIAISDGPIVLVASRGSEFKKALVDQLCQSLATSGMAHRTVGVGDLKNIKTDNYHAVVVISACLAQGLDSDVDLFIGQQKKNATIIHVITSADGDWKPDAQDHDIDAISSASELTDVDAVVRNVIRKIKANLN